MEREGVSGWETILEEWFEDVEDAGSIRPEELPLDVKLEALMGIYRL